MQNSSGLDYTVLHSQSCRSL